MVLLLISSSMGHFPRSQFDDEEGKERAKEQIGHV
jgi:hypothetical protein